MQLIDLKKVNAIANQVHVNHPEDDSILWERFELWNRGCHVLEDNQDVVGYLVSHPILMSQPPVLNTLLTRLPDPADAYYFHDVALLPQYRKQGLVIPMMNWMLSKSAEFGFDTACLISVNHTSDYWKRYGFITVDDADMDAKLISYGADARYMKRKLNKAQQGL
jgi:ribosomal protein S18 acetylase RimI-like enzyme